jgi:hypothetical protein
MRYSVAAAITLPGIVSLTGCGGGGGGGASTSSLSAVDSQVSAISTLQTTGNTQNALLSSVSSELLTGSSLTSQTGLMLASTASTPPLPTYPLFVKHVDMLPNTYATWGDYITAHNLAYKQVNDQITKIKASLRLYGYKQKLSGVTSVGVQTSTISQNAISVSSLVIDAVTLSISTFIHSPNNTLLGALFTTINDMLIAILSWIKDKSLSNLSFNTNMGILTSIANMSVAVVSALGIVGLTKLKEQSVSGLTADAQTAALARAVKTQSLLTLVLTSTVNYMMNYNLSKIQADLASTNSSFTPPFADSATLATSLNEQATLLQTLGSILQSVSQIYTANDTTTLTTYAQNVGFLFTAENQTSSQAATFATHMADLAYQFTSQMETDAYNFASQGMTYGYLFASRGEEVGLMADRVLWMAVQIGVMADRIGQMADRIVYTEQLIVYTEMLILDFGLLIYGGMKQISNTMLMGMAIVFDRQWYTPSTTDPILTVISDMTQTMLTNMQEYEKIVLDNQKVLQTITQDALRWLPSNT